MSSYSNILYIFGSGRKEKILTNNLDSSEFFYGYFHMKSKFKDIDSIEMLPNGADLKKHQKVLEFFDIKPKHFDIGIVNPERFDLSDFKNIKSSD